MVYIAYYLVYLVVNCRSKIYVYKNGRFIKNLPLITIL